MDGEGEPGSSLFSYQSAPYFTESTHNFYLQILVEGRANRAFSHCYFAFLSFLSFIKNRHSLPSQIKF